jgi:hypothetical protein
MVPGENREAAMPQHFEVIGDYDDDVEGEYDDDDDVEGDVMGDIMGYAGPMGDYEGEVVGYDEYGEPIIVGARRRKKRRRRRRRVTVRKPNWRRRQLAPGVVAPDQGMLILPLEGTVGNQFTAAINQITFQGQLQKPFRGERLLVSTVRTGASAVGRLLSLLWVGTDLQQIDINGFDAEQVGSPAAFGVRLAMKPAQPGVFIRMVATLNAALAGVDTIDATVSLLGRAVH